MGYKNPFFKIIVFFGMTSLFKKNPQTEGKTIQFVDVDTDVCSLMVWHYFASFSK